MGGNYRVLSRAIDQAGVEHRQRMAEAKKVAEAAAKGMILAYQERSNGLMVQKVACLKEAYNGGYLEEVLGHGNGKSSHQEERHVEHAVDQAGEGQVLDAAGAVGGHQEGQEQLSLGY